MIGKFDISRLLWLKLGINFFTFSQSKPYSRGIFWWKRIEISRFVVNCGNSHYSMPEKFKCKAGNSGDKFRCKFLHRENCPLTPCWRKMSRLISRMVTWKNAKNHCFLNYRGFIAKDRIGDINIANQSAKKPWIGTLKEENTVVVKEKKITMIVKKSLTEV